MKHIVILAVADFPNGLATAERIKLIAKTLMDAGWNAEVAIIHPTKLNAKNLKMEVTGEYEGIRYSYLNGAAVRPSGILASAVDTLRGMWRAGMLIKHYAKAKKVDAVIFYTPNFIKIFPAFWAAKSTQTPIFFELCEVVTSTGSATKSSLMRRFMSVGERLTESLGPKYADGLIVISQRIDSFYRKKGVVKENLFYLPALVDFKAINESLKPLPQLINRKFFLSASSYGKKEGIDYILRAFQSVREQYHDIYLVFTGLPANDIEMRMRTQAAELGINNHLLFTGYIDRDELAWCYQNATALLACRTNTDFAQYGFPTKLVEYMASGTPILATRVGAVTDYMENGVNAYIANPEDADSIGRKMVEVLDDESKAKIIGTRAKELAAEHFDYHCYSEPLNRFISNI